jgi:hypothetical protein
MLVVPTLAVNLTECFIEIRDGTHGPHGGTDPHGHPVSNISDAVGITHALCKSACETGPEPFEWSAFSQQFSAWLLPWFALVSQLPFGASDRLENLTSVLLAVGSPTLATYSLALTILNGRWVAQRFSDIAHPNRKHAFHVMSSLQQAPLNITGEDALRSLVVLPENNKWWEVLVERLDYTHTWSIPAAASIIWVSLAHLFTVIDAFISLPPNPTGDSISQGSDGQAVGTVWLWLVAIVVGWLQISPKCDRKRLDAALFHANEIAHVATDKGSQLICPAEAAFTMHRASQDALDVDVECSPPIFNYARVFLWTQNVEQVVAVFCCAADRARGHRRVGEDEWDKTAGHFDENRKGNLQQVWSMRLPL